MPASTWPCLAQPGGCACHCHKISEGRRNGHRRASVRDWTPGEIQTLKRLLSQGEPIEGIIPNLEKRHGTPRSRRSVVAKAIQLGLLYRQGWYSAHEVQVGLGVSWTTAHRWIADGLLPARRHVGIIHGTQTKWWHITEADLMQFIGAQAGRLFRPTTVKNPEWRRRAEVAAPINRRRGA